MLPVTSCLVPFLLLAHFSGASSVYFSNFLREEGNCTADAQESWSYRGGNGPEFWGQNYPECNGENQSPINIVTTEAMNNPDLGKLQLVNYDVPVSSYTVLNNGHTIQVTPTDGVERTMEAEGSIFSLVQFHFHWGNCSKIGSEHTLDGCSYAMEIHFVHQNEEDQLAVVGVLVKEGRKCNAEMRKHCNVLEEVKFRNQSTQQDNVDLNLRALLPANPASYYRYHGSLTTPRCSEGVIWSVLKGHLHVCHSQMKKFRQLHSDRREENNDACHIDNNYRPVQPLNNRVVYESQ